MNGTELVIIRAPDDATLLAQISRLVSFLDRVPDCRLEDVAYTCTFGDGSCALAVVAESVADLRARLASAKSRLQGGARRIRDKSGTYCSTDRPLANGAKLAFVFPGVASFYPDMMRDLAYLYPECRSAFDELEEALKDDAESFVPSSFIFPPAPHYRHDADIFSSGAYAQALVSTYSGCIALTRLLEFFGVRPDGICGFAGGDIASLVGFGAMGQKASRADRLRLVRELYRLVDKAVNHAGLPKTEMLSVFVKSEEDLAQIEESLPPGAFKLAMEISSRQKIFSVAVDFAAEAERLLAGRGVKYVKMALDRPFNTSDCASLLPDLRRFADGWMKNIAVCDVYSCATAAKVPRQVKAQREDSVTRWTMPVRLSDTIAAMYGDGYRVFLEVGPRGMITAAIGDALKGLDHAAMAANSIHRRGQLQLQHALAQLAALGARVDLRADLERRRARKLDFDSSFSLEIRQERELKLSRRFPRLTLAMGEDFLPSVSPLAEPKSHAAKLAARAAAIEARSRRRRQFDSGAMNPLISDADTLDHQPGVSIYVKKRFKLADFPFIADTALGTSQLSYSDPNLQGLVILSMPVAAEIMAELATLLAPNRELVAVEDLFSRKTVEFRDGILDLYLKAERVASGDPEKVAIRVVVGTSPFAENMVWAAMESTFVFAKALPDPIPVSPDPLLRPRSVHWAGREIYPARLSCGSRLRAIKFVESWAETGLDYELVVPKLAGCVAHTLFPLWQINPLLLETVASGFKLWRSHERFAGAWSFPFRVRRIEFHALPPGEDQRLRCYLRLAGVTPKSQICNISVSDGNGTALMTINGWEEYSQRIPPEYQQLVMQPATSFVTKPLPAEIMGTPSADVASAFVTGIPYALFERDEEVWLKTFSNIVLSQIERGTFAGKTGSAARRTEWLFGRIAAKEAVRRFLKTYYQARWSYADVTICANDLGKPYAIGAWLDYLSANLDIAIAHTSQFVVAIAGANVKIGVDVESIQRNLSEEFTAGVFNPEELELATSAVNPAQAIIKFWCAKEAVSKALGVGLRYSPKDLRVAGYDFERGKLSMRLYGGWEDAFHSLKGTDIEVSVSILHDHALAFCFVPSMLLAE